MLTHWNSLEKFGQIQVRHPHHIVTVNLDQFYHQTDRNIGVDHLPRHPTIGNITTEKVACNRKTRRQHSPLNRTSNITCMTRDENLPDGHRRHCRKAPGKRMEKHILNPLPPHVLTMRWQETPLNWRTLLRKNAQQPHTSPAFQLRPNRRGHLSKTTHQFEKSRLLAFELEHLKTKGRKLRGKLIGLQLRNTLTQHVRRGPVALHVLQLFQNRKASRKLTHILLRGIGIEHCQFDHITQLLFTCQPVVKLALRHRSIDHNRIQKHRLPPIHSHTLTRCTKKDQSLPLAQEP